MPNARGLCPSTNSRQTWAIRLPNSRMGGRSYGPSSSFSTTHDLTVVSPRLDADREVVIAEPGRAAVVELRAMSLGFDIGKATRMRRQLSECPDRLTGGAAGRPVLQFGRCLHVPREALAPLVRGPLPKASYVGSNPL